MELETSERPGIVRRRLVICVDGVDYKPTHSGNTKQTSVYRIYSSIKHGQVIDGPSKSDVQQIPLYYPGLGDAHDIVSKDFLQIGSLGQSHQDQIRNIYEKCCELSDGDEVAFFAFSKGAFVVRAVAGLLHHIGVLRSAGTAEFARDYKKVLKHSGPKLERASTICSGSLSLSATRSVSSLSSASTSDFRPAPKILFLGAFDTVKAVNDDSFDISFHDSIHNFRHAVAIHENRKALSPETLFPETFYKTDLSKEGRSFVQALFIGTHEDMGGSSPTKAGLSLYSLQWMVLEAINCGMHFEHLDAAPTKDHKLPVPLSVVFPQALVNGKPPARMTFTTANGIHAIMQDLRTIHNAPNLQSEYGIKLGSRPASLRLKKERTLFDSNGYLCGYCDHAPQGTIIHPSVYLLLDEHINIALDTKEAQLQRLLEDWRERMLGTENGHVNFGFWSDSNADDDVDPGAIRVLVCGNTGVGKSTLINKTFGVEVTQSSNRSRGIHDVKQEITFDGRPDLIVHDSGGFEAGADTEFLAIEEFLKEKSTAEEVRDRLHVIWFCVEINSARTLQTATEKLYQAVSTYAHEVPIVVVATKKDDLLDIEWMSKKKELKKMKLPHDDDVCEAYAEEKLQERLDDIRHEMESVPGGRLDAIVAVSQEDEDSIAFLSKTTSHTFDLDKVRLLYIRAQVTRIDLKVDLALCEVMRRYRPLVKTATGVSFTPIGATTHRKTAAAKVCKAILNCFGLPSLSSETAIATMKQNVWDHLGFDVLMAVAEGLNVLGATGTGFAGGIPAFLVTGAISVPLVVPSTCRLFLTMSADLILVLILSFKLVALQNRQPQEKDFQQASRAFQLKGYSAHVQQDIKDLIPRTSLRASYKYDKVRIGLESTVDRYKERLMEGEQLPIETKVRRGIEEDEEDVIAIHQAQGQLAELDGAIPPAELPAGKESITIELPVHEKPAELMGDAPPRHVVELPGHIKLPDPQGGVPQGRLAELPG
ncbi:Putative GTP binding domain, P-loop containing nucleoside triphosphate hydrolase [Septoria linicola]|uniref:GTP binding domain, P-loop containing nucleoside triphosphate hydrolase n=1 Tax=Septoria linicola TaxID=215465 RepID=A0A9Q9EL19_9PEZI|nr:putative GTP binding domain, P-loop containing nucleoside triphosphate hydrolase [Septoria linicola]USW54645.1 Putative GTP binding domain, P-loop containing nucleoside triphosphate hydrolase [Septoria linicola]